MSAITKHTHITVRRISDKMAEKSNIHLYTAQTPNGIKVSIVLEELGLKYEVGLQVLANLLALYYHANSFPKTTNIEFSKNTQKVRF